MYLAVALSGSKDLFAPILLNLLYTPSCYIASMPGLVQVWSIDIYRRGSGELAYERLPDGQILSAEKPQDGVDLPPKAPMLTVWRWEYWIEVKYDVKDDW